MFGKLLVKLLLFLWSARGSGSQNLDAGAAKLVHSK